LTPHLALDIADPSQVGEARRAAARLATDVGLDDTAGGRVALAVTELGTNLSRHATGGRLLIAAHADGGREGIDVVSMDHGPGMADVERCLADGYSTGGTAGTGLGAVQRLCDEFSMFSVLGKGTVIFGRVLIANARSAAPAAATRFIAGAVCLAAPGETVCGDAWSFRAEGASASLIVADGLGHGPVAAEAADAALAVFAARPACPPAQLLTLAHDALRSTRGAAVAIAALDAEAGTLLFCGAGNIAGRLISGIADRSLLSQHGTVGLQIRRLQDVTYEWGEHAILVLHSDGLTTRWTLADAGGLLQCHPVVIAAWLIRDQLRGRDDATVVVVRRR